jgi:prophage tail gpP-like protein
MPFKAQEVAEVTIKGKRFRDWESVIVRMEEGNVPNSFKLSVSEGAPLSKTFAEMQIKPGDHCTVTLAGELAITGYVETRQVAYTAEQHGIEIVGHSLNKAAVDASVMHKTMEFKNKGISQIATELLKPLGLKWNPKTQISEKPFPRVNIAHGTSVHEQIETLARLRGVTLGTDLQGNYTARTQFEQGGDKLEEGKNILEGKETLTMSMSGGASGNYYYGQEPGSNEKHGPKVAHDPQGKSKNDITGMGKGLHAPNTSVVGMPGDKMDAKTNADMEGDRRDYEKFEVTITVQGWLKPSGGLWKPGEMIHVKSPMLIVDEKLKLMKADFTQDNKSGTRTTLLLTKDTGDGSKYNYDPNTKTTGTDPKTGAPAATPVAETGPPGTRSPSLGE